MTRPLGIWVVGWVLLIATPLQANIAEIDRGDTAFQARAIDAKAEEALALYRQAVSETDRKDPQALWRLAMGCYFVGLRLTPSQSEREKIFFEGQEAGKASVALDPGCAACHFWTAINMALYGDTVGVFKMLFSLQEIQTHLKETVRLDPGYAHAGAYRLLGIIQQKLPGILGGSDDRAEQYFKKAITEAPDEPLNFLFLAKLLRESLHQSEAAVSTAKKGLEIHELSVDRLESREAQRDLQEFLKN